MAVSEKDKTIVVPRLEGPLRIDKYLAELTELDLSRSFIQSLVTKGLVTVNGRAVSKNHRLSGGETVQMRIPPPEVIDMAPEEIPLEIVYEDEYLAVVNKPAGMVVHPAPGNPRHTLVNALLFRFGLPEGSDDQLRPGIIHRLDKNTSGLLIVARQDRIAQKVRQQFSERKVIKIYNAIICGHMPEMNGTINLPVGRSLRDRKKMTVTHLHSREAVTHYRVLERFRLNDLLELRLETGRTHQIRVHLSHLNRPLLGDPDYGGRAKWIKGIDPALRRAAEPLVEMIDRQALHARTVTFTHPVTGLKVEVTSELPDDIARVLEFLRAGQTA